MIDAAATWERIRDSVAGVELTDEQLNRVDQEERELNQWRLRWILPLMILMNLAHVALLVPDLMGSSGPPALVLWAQGLLLVHGVTALCACVPLTLAWVLERPPGWLGPLGALVYQLHAAAVAGVDQLNHGTVAPYVAYTLVNVVVVAMTPLQAIVVFTTSTLAFIGALELMQADVVQRMATLPTGPSVLVPAVCIAWFLHNARRKSLYFRDTIAQQGQALAALNADLQTRVDDQVASLVARSAEVEALNQQLLDQVRDRSKELAAALERLARHEPHEDVLRPGMLLAGRFELGAPLGHGGMGVVHSGVDCRTREAVAIKLIRGGHMPPSTMVRFLREVESASSVRHPGIVRMLHVDVTEQGTPFQVQELVVGQTLSVWLDRLGALDPDVVIPLIAGLCEALAVAHDKGVIHRDIKPSNLMLTADEPGFKLLDFGIAKQAGLGDLTVTGAMVGTPAYMGPELWEGRAASTASDLFAVGVTAVRALSGVLPRAYLGHDEDSLDLPVPAEVRLVLTRCLAEQPSSRPTAMELAAVLRRHARGEGLAKRVGSGQLGVARTIMGDGPTHLSFG